MFLIRFWSNLTKKDSVENASYEINKIFYLQDFFRSDPDFRPIPTREKTVRYGSWKKTRIRNTAKNNKFVFLHLRTALHFLPVASFSHLRDQRLKKRHGDLKRTYFHHCTPPRRLQLIETVFQTVHQIRLRISEDRPPGSGSRRRENNKK